MIIKSKVEIAACGITSLVPKSLERKHSSFVS